MYNTTQLQCFLDVADKAASLFEKTADLTSFPGNSSGRPSDADIRDCIEKFAEVADSAQKGVRWLRRAGSQLAAYLVEEVARGFKRVYDYICTYRLSDAPL